MNIEWTSPGTQSSVSCTMSSAYNRQSLNIEKRKIEGRERSRNRNKKKEVKGKTKSQKKGMGRERERQEGGKKRKNRKGKASFKEVLK